MKQSQLEELFPYDSFFPKQFDLIVEVLDALYQKDYDNVVIDAGTGTGKSAVNVTAAEAGREIDGSTSFYVTPQKKLREQLQEDDVLSEYYTALRGREDYVCGVSGKNCRDCPVNASADKSCSQMDECTYWNNKLTAMSSDIAVLTFAYLIVDGSIPQYNVSGMPISFGDRDLLIVDECHNLESQVASLFAGFAISPWSLPLEVFGNITSDLDMDNTTRHYQVMDKVEKLENRADDYRMELNQQSRERELDKDEVRGLEQCEKFLNKVEWFFEEVENGRDWVVETDETKYSGRLYKTFKLKPVRVDKFLRNFVWSRGKKRILSTATMPHRDNPDKWLAQIGLPGKTHIIRVGMPIPPGHRPVHTDTIIASMSNGGDKKHWDEIMSTLNVLADKHKGQKGLIHSASYRRAEKVWQSAQSEGYTELEGNVISDRADANSDQLMYEWQNGDKDIFVSPAMTEGVDLKDDKCRWQVLLKVPLPSPGNPRVEYLLNEVPHIGWPWYWETTGLDIVQSAGRAVRSVDDYADYYVLDEQFNKIRKKVSFPEWFEESIDTEPTYGFQERNALSW